MPRKATWAIIIWTVLMIVWAVTVTNAVGQACTAEQANRGACELGANVGGALGVGLIFFIWLIGFLVLTVIWFMSRPQRRLCPACGQPAKKGVTVCTRCGFDFRAAAGGQPMFQVQPPAGPPQGWGQQSLPPGPPLGPDQPLPPIPDRWGPTDSSGRP